jgi:DNA-binding NarL/FixJ family response regulator
MKSGIRDSECLNYSNLAYNDGENCTRQISLYSIDGTLQTGESAVVEAKNSCIVLIDPRPLTRTSISRLLAGDSSANRRSEDLTVWPVASPEEFLAIYPSDATEVALIVFNLGSLCSLDETVRAERGRLRDEFPGIPMILLSDCANPAHILSSLRDGVRGYVPSALESSMVIQVIRLVLAGGTFIPPGVLAAAGDASGGVGEPPGFEAGPRRHPSELTPRQSEVFELLRQGKSNKLIAYELGMQESTVKVHVRQIMRKLKAINRTHAVFLAEAMGNGGELS